MCPLKSDPAKTGKFISDLRKETDMTQLSLAAALRVSHQAVSKWETGAALPDIDILLALAELFGVSIGELLAGERGETEPNGDAADDKTLYSQTMADVIKTGRDIPLLLEAYGEMREEDITDCIQTLCVRDAGILLKLFGCLSSGKIAQIIIVNQLRKCIPSGGCKTHKSELLQPPPGHFLSWLTIKHCAFRGYYPKYHTKWNIRILPTV